MPVTLDQLTVADSPAAWRECGFALEAETCAVGETRIRLAPSDRAKGLVSWSLRGVETDELDGLATTRSDRPAPAQRSVHPNGVTALDHLVAISSDLDRTVATLRAAGLASLGDRVSEIRDAVQPGRRIVTLRRAAGLSLPLALITPPVRSGGSAPR